MAGIPVVVIAGVVAINRRLRLVGYLHYDQLGTNSNLGKLFAWTIGPAVLGAVFYVVVAAVKKRRGTDITLVYGDPR